MPIYHHLQHALRILKLPGSQWIAELEKLTPEARAECEPWLRLQAQRLRTKKQYALQPDSSATPSSPTKKS